MQVRSTGNKSQFWSSENIYFSFTFEGQFCCVENSKLVALFFCKYFSLCSSLVAYFLRRSHIRLAFSLQDIGVPLPTLSFFQEFSRSIYCLVLDVNLGKFLVTIISFFFFCFILFLFLVFPLYVCYMVYNCPLVLGYSALLFLSLFFLLFSFSSFYWYVPKLRNSFCSHF